MDDHPNLLFDPTRNLFEAFRKEVLALDTCVTEEFLKQCVAYKAETNFVDIAPLKSRLRLSLNMPFRDLEDSKGLAKDITDIGHWGNGDVEVNVKNIDDIPYVMGLDVMGLVRQAWERQIDESE